MSARRSVRLLIEDIAGAISSIFRRTDGLAREKFVSDETLLKATVFDLQTIGEASKRLPPELRDANPQVPWKQMASTRDFLAHGYYRLEPDLVWEIVERISRR